MSNQRQYPRTMMKCRIKISHPAFGSLTAQTKDLSDGGVFIEHPDLAALAVGDEVTGQVQDMPIEAPVLRMVIQRVVAGGGVGLAFLDEE
ncbi:PilZ domain-containing protein [Halopseudomonas litoralis]|uniref:PilZ domain-containing protein n=1 Tax=Halopseudomonas litoralis TaxID=797277 RepID=A0A1H1WY71_9GAMM|nr:PilZ domain-containing protein [Halopseudomonas litoralis]SDT02093.1 PilZ domain-containing protein [Halopseudomonas litoralis]